ncbi:MAG: hypothetical protein ACI4V7_07215 [Succinivibrionaceae bacterium]
MMLTKIFNAFKNNIAIAKVGIMAMGLIVCSSVVDANAADKKRQYTVGDIKYFQNSLLLKEIEANIYRYKSSMTVITYTDNREDFLYNRDELWGSRENLSYAIANMKDFLPQSPYQEDCEEVINMSQDLLIKSETYANNQNELIALYSKVKDLRKDISSLFEKIKESESLVGRKKLSFNEDELFIKVSQARSIYEIMFTSFFDAKTSAEAGEVVVQLNKSLISYQTLMSDAASIFPEMQESYAIANKEFSKLFSEKGLGNLYYSYLVKKEEQYNISNFFHKSTKDIINKLNLVQTKIRMRLE